MLLFISLLSFSVLLFFLNKLPLKCKHKVLILIMSEIILIVINVGFIILNRGKDRNLTAEFLSNMKNSDMGYYFSDYEKEYDEFTTVLQYTYRNLGPGTYTGIIHYQTHDEQQISFSSLSPQFLLANNIILDHRQHQCVFYVTLTEPVKQLSISVDYKGNRSFIVTGLNFFQGPISYLKNIALIIILFSVCEFIIMIRVKKPEWIKTIIFLLFISVFSFLPYLLKGFHIGFDFNFHFMRIEGLAYELRRGLFPVYMQSLWLTGYGSPVSMFYGDALLYIPAILRLMGFSFDFAFKFYIFIINLLTAAFAYISFKEIFRKKSVAQIASFAYMCGHYRFIQLYVSYAIGQFTADTFLPLICAGFYCICTYEPDSNTKKSRFLHLNGYGKYIKYILMLSLGLAGLITSHILTLEMTLALLVVISILKYKRLFRKDRIIAILLSGGFAIILGLGFLVPFLDSYISNDVKIKHAVNANVNIQKGGVYPGDLFAFFKDIFDSKNHFYLSIGLTLMACLCIAIYLIAKKRSSRKLTFFTILSITCLFLSTNIFPWDHLAYYSRVWKILAQIQFPSRYLIFATLFSIMVLGELLTILDDTKNNISLVWNPLKLTICLLSFLMILEYIWLLSNYSSYSTRRNIINTNEVAIGLAGALEYERYGEDILTLADEVIAQNVSFSGVKQEGTNMKLYCETGNDEGTVSVPIINYKGYMVEDEFGNKYEIFDGINKEISFRVPSNYQGIIKVSFKPMWYWQVAFYISCFSVFILLFYSIYYRGHSSNHYLFQIRSKNKKD